jgi:hypothetical protein
VAARAGAYVEDSITGLESALRNDEVYVAGGTLDQQLTEAGTLPEAIVELSEPLYVASPLRFGECVDRIGVGFAGS